LLTDSNNIQINQQVKHNLFDLRHTENHVLTIYLGYDELSFAITSVADNTVVYLKSYRLKDADNHFAYKLLVNDLAEQEELFKNTYHNIVIALSSTPYTLVPHKYFELSSAEDYYNFNYKQDNNSKIMANFVTGYNCFAIYAVDLQLADTFTRIFDNFTLQHAISYLLPALPPPNEGKGMYVYVQKSHADIVCLNGDKLLFCNTVSVYNPDELLYHLLNTAKHTGISISHDPIIIWGDTTSEQPLYQLCSQYLPKLSLGNRPAHLNYCPELSVISAHQHFNLFCMR